MKQFAVSVILENPRDSTLIHAMELAYAESREVAISGCAKRSEEEGFSLRGALAIEVREPVAPGLVRTSGPVPPL